MTIATWLRKIFRLPKPNPAARYPSDPRAVFILVLCIVSGIPLIFDQSNSPSLDSFLSAAAVKSWGIVLVFGSLVTLYGMARQTRDGVLLEQVGSIIVGAGTILYGGFTFFYSDMDLTPATAITLGFGLSCFWRWGQLQSLVKKTVEQVVAMKAAKIEASKARRGQ